MPAGSHVTAKFPVVFHKEAGPSTAWYFRPADVEALYGPFASRDDAVAFALKAMSEGIPENMVPAEVRRAA